MEDLPLKQIELEANAHPNEYDHSTRPGNKGGKRVL